MKHSIQKAEKYALIQLQEASLGAELATPFEEVARGVLRDGLHNLIIHLNTIKEVGSEVVVILRKINILCVQNLGILVLVTKDDGLWDSLEALNIPDLVVLPSVDEAIDAVFMHELENEFGSDEDDFDSEDYVTGEED